MAKKASKKTAANTAVAEMELSLNDEVVEEVKMAQKATEDFTMNHHKRDETSELLDTKVFGETGVMDDKNHPQALGKCEIWTDQPRFYLKRLPASCFFNPWNYQKGSKNDIRYIDVYNRKPKWVEVTAQIFQLYERFILGEEDEGKVIHNNLLLSQAERLYINSL